MKTFKLLTVMLCLLLASIGCQKEQTGAYTPTKKIQQIYFSNLGNKIPYQIWSWNGDHLETITHCMGNGKNRKYWVEKFTYDDNRITRVDNFTDSEYIIYEYDGNCVKSATVFSHNVLACIWEVSYNGKNIDRLSCTSYHKEDRALHLNPLSHLLPQNMYGSVIKYEQDVARQHRQEDTYTYDILLTWRENNISKVVFFSDGKTMSMEMQYDDKKCPWYDFMGSFQDYTTNFFTGHTGLTKNNITTMCITDTFSIDTMCYAYQYDSDDYPILQTLYPSYDIDDKEILYFEY